MTRLAWVVAALLVASCKRGPITQTVICTGVDEVVYEGRTFDVPGGVAIEARDVCKLTCKNCAIRGKTAIRSDMGNAEITLTGGTIEGTDGALDVDGNARVEVNGTSIKGKSIARGKNTRVKGVDHLGSNLPPEEIFRKSACDQ